MVSRTLYQSSLLGQSWFAVDVCGNVVMMRAWLYVLSSSRASSTQVPQTSGVSIRSSRYSLRALVNPLTLT